VKLNPFTCDIFGSVTLTECPTPIQLVEVGDVPVKVIVFGTLLSVMVIVNGKVFADPEAILLGSETILVIVRIPFV
jgi:hypothetical protein